MKTYQIYVCEKCGFESINPKEVELCEAKHIGLNSIEEYRDYNYMKSFVEYCTEKLLTKNNEKFRDIKKFACKNLLMFEKEHNIKVQ